MTAFTGTPAKKATQHSSGTLYMHQQNILFDLDGTLTDPRLGITRSIQYALAKLGIDEPDLARLEHFIGPPLLQAFMQFYSCLLYTSPSPRD